MTSPDEIGFLAKAADYIWPLVGALVGIIWKFNTDALKEHRMETAQKLTQHRADVSAQFIEIHKEQDLQRSHIAKLFDKLEANSQRSEDRHRELMTALHQGLNSKADK